MYSLENTGCNSKGHLIVGGIDMCELAKQYGTPLYVVNEDLVRENCRRYVKSVAKFYKNGMVSYASKALCNIAMCKIMQQEGMGIDVASGGEVYTAKVSGYDMSKAIFHGNNKPIEEIKFAIQSGVGRIVCDHVAETEMIDKIAGELGVVQKILIRLNPGVEAHTHEFIKTGQIDSKFGFAIQDGNAIKAVGQILKFKNINFAGIHTHIGSQIFDYEPFELAAKIMMNFINDVKVKYGHTLTELNLGGGFGIRYLEEHNPVSYEIYIEKISVVVKELAVKFGLPEPFIIMEPGRSIVATAGVTLYSAGHLKEIENIRNYLAIDGGMADNIRYALYKAPYTVINASRMNEESTETYTVCGRCCESGDLIQEGVKMPKTQYGDIVAVLATGAYNYSMSSNYNRLPKPAMVFLSQGKSRVVVKRETYEDIIRNDLI